MAEESSSSESDDQEPKMFDGLTAWFSSSVTQRRRDLWIQNDGQLGDADSVMYVFSEDAASQDTVSLFESESYLKQHLAIFHPTYIEECLRQADMKLVTLGDFFLPPADVHEACNAKFHWEVLMQNEQEAQERTPRKSLRKKTSQSSKAESRTQPSKTGVGRPCMASRQSQSPSPSRHSVNKAHRSPNTRLRQQCSQSPAKRKLRSETTPGSPRQLRGCARKDVASSGPAATHASPPKRKKTRQEEGDCATGAETQEPQNIDTSIEDCGANPKGSKCTIL